MKRILLSILALFFPWMVILIDGQPIAALACLALQLTFIGWIPASIWAWKVTRRMCEADAVMISDVETVQNDLEPVIEKKNPKKEKEPTKHISSSRKKT